MAIKVITIDQGSFFVPDNSTPEQIAIAEQDYIRRLQAFNDFLGSSFAQETDVDTVINDAAGGGQTDPGLAATGQAGPGALNRASAAVSGLFGGVASLAAPGSVAKAISAMETFEGVQTGIQRADAIEAAARPDASRADLEAAAKAAPGIGDVIGNVLGVGLSLATGNVVGLALTGLEIASDVEAQQAATQAEQALSSAAATPDAAAVASTAQATEQSQQSGFAQPAGVTAETEVQGLESFGIEGVLGGAETSSSTGGLAGIAADSQGTSIGDAFAAAAGTASTADMGDISGDAGEGGTGGIGGTEGTEGAGFGGGGGASETGADPGAGNVA